MITLLEENRFDNNRHSSKGNLLKWKYKDFWYKADSAGYESLVEYMVSNLLKLSSLSPDEYVHYEMTDIEYEGHVFHGAYSQNFLPSDWQLITLERLFSNHFGKSLTESIYHIHDEKNRLIFLTEQIERITGLKDFGIYMSKLLTIDALFLNEDRHMHNIGVLMKPDGEYALCPIFDHGAALLSDIRLDYPLNQDIYALLSKPESKTICRSFDEQLDCAEELFGINIHFSWTEADILKLIKPSAYSAEINERVLTILRQQKRKYAYLFS